MEIIVGYDFKKNGYTLDELREEFRETYDDLYDTEEEIVSDDPSHLIVMVEDKLIIGWAIWHESNTREHRLGSPRDEEDIEILEKLSNGRCAFIELHELWLKKAHRGKGYGKQFFDFFEKFVAEKGYDKLVFYAFNESAISICRKRGYKESYYENEKEFTFYKVVDRS
jgi:GNAT superfamily N-acetyltransferase